MRRISGISPFAIFLFAACSSGAGLSSVDEVAEVFSAHAEQCAEISDEIGGVEEETREILELAEYGRCSEPSVVDYIYVFETENARLRFLVSALASFGCGAAPDSVQTYFYGSGWLAEVSVSNEDLLDQIAAETESSWNSVTCNTANFDALPPDVDPFKPQAPDGVLAEVLGE